MDVIRKQMQMKKFLSHFCLLSFLVGSLSGNAQSGEEFYRTHRSYYSQEGEMIFSFANIESSTMSVENILRWSPVFNYTGHVNYDFSKNFGVNLGLGFRNVGFIAKFPDEPNGLKKKYRTYNLGLPIGIKIGDLHQKHPFFLFGGYELEMPFQYKEKTFENGDKTDKITGWFSNRTDRFTQSLFAGVQFPQGFSLKFKYYLNNFFNEDFTVTKDNISTKPYAGFEARVFYFSITWYPFQDSKLFEIPLDEPSGTVTSANW